MKVYVGITGTGRVVRGTKGQSVFNCPGTLRRTVGSNPSMQHEANNMGCRVRDLYDVYEFELNFNEGRLTK